MRLAERRTLAIFAAARISIGVFHVKRIEREMCHGCGGRGVVQLGRGKTGAAVCPFKARATLPIWPVHRHCPVCLGLGWYEKGGAIWLSVRGGR